MKRKFLELWSFKSKFSGSLVHRCRMQDAGWGAYVWSFQVWSLFCFCFLCALVYCFRVSDRHLDTSQHVRSQLRGTGPSSYGTGPILVDNWDRSHLIQNSTISLISWQFHAKNWLRHKMGPVPRLDTVQFLLFLDKFHAVQLVFIRKNWFQ